MILNNNLSLEDNTIHKLLVIAPYAVIPAETGGKIRVFELAKGLSKKNILVTVLMPASPGQIFKKKINKNLFFKTIPYPFVLPFLFSEKPFSFLYLMSFHPGYRFLISDYLKSFDIIQFEGASFGNLIDHIQSDKIVVYDAHNVEYDYEKSEHTSKLIREISSNRIWKLEKKIAQRANKILTCSDEDAARLSNIYEIDQDKCLFVPNGIHLPRQNKEKNGLEPKGNSLHFESFSSRAIFSGSNAEHNRVAVKFIIEHVAPKLINNCAFIIQGQCGKQFQNSQLSNVFFDTEPGNVGKYADICNIALNPVTQGSGTSLKVLDYLAHGLSVVSTNFGMRGYDQLKKYVSLAEIDNFPERIQKAQPFDPEIYSIIEKYSWEKITTELSQIYKFF